MFSRIQLLTWLKRRARAKKAESTATKGDGDDSDEEEDNDGRLVVGTVGYPNVGKSSVINVLVGTKKVGVAALPGKTKHF